MQIAKRGVKNMEKITFDLLLKSALDLFYGAIDALEAEEYENVLINEL